MDVKNVEITIKNPLKVTRIKKRF